MNEFKELFECLDDVLHDYCTTYDPIEYRESKVATVSTQKIVSMHEAYNRCKEQAHEMNHYFMPMDSAPRDGTKILLLGKIDKCIVEGRFIANHNEYGESESGWKTAHHFCQEWEFIGWFPIPKIPEELIKVTEDNKND